MSIDLNKPGDGSHNQASSNSSSNSSSNTASSQQNNSSVRPNYADPNSSAEVREIYRVAYACKERNMPDYQIEQTLMNRGLTPGDVADVMRVVNRAVSSRQQASQDSDTSEGPSFGTIIKIILVILQIILAIVALSQ